MISLKKYLFATLLLAIFSTIRSEEPLLKSGKDVTEDRPTKGQVDPFGGYDPNDPFAKAEQERQQAQQGSGDIGGGIEITPDKEGGSEVDLGRGIQAGTGITSGELPSHITISKKSGFSGILAALKEFFKRIVGSPTLKSTLGTLNDTLDKIAARPETEAITTGDLDSLQRQISDVAQALNAAPRSADITALRGQLDSLASALYGSGLDLEDIMVPRDQLPYARQAVSWIDNPTESVRKILADNASSLTLNEQQSLVNLNNPIRGSIRTAIEQLTPRTGQDKSDFALGSPGEVISHIDTAVRTLDLELNPPKPEEGETPLEPAVYTEARRIVQFQDAYATFIAARTLVSTLLTAPVDAETMNKALDTLKQAKSNLKQITDINKQLGIIINVQP